MITEETRIKLQFKNDHKNTSITRAPRTYIITVALAFSAVAPPGIFVWGLQPTGPGTRNSSSWVQRKLRQDVWGNPQKLKQLADIVYRF